MLHRHNAPWATRHARQHPKLRRKTSTAESATNAQRARHGNGGVGGENPFCVPFWDWSMQSSLVVDRVNIYILPASGVSEFSPVLRIMFGGNDCNVKTVRSCLSFLLLTSFRTLQLFKCEDFTPHCTSSCQSKPQCESSANIDHYSVNAKYNV